MKWIEWNFICNSSAINVADKYVEKYLPSEDQVDCK